MTSITVVSFIIAGNHLEGTMQRMILPLLLCIIYLVSYICGDTRLFTDADDRDEFFLKSFFYDETYNIQSNNFPILLWWTKRIFPDRKTKSVSKIICERGQCLTTLDRNYLMNNRTRGVLFHGTEIVPHDLPLPRQPWHEWALFHEESPLNNYMLCHQSFLRLFNHTATSRRESDFPLSLQWIPDENYLTSRKPLSISLKNYFRQKENFAPVLYIQSHCELPSDRDRYVKELMKFIKVDSFGKCLNNKKWKKEFHSPANNLNNPKFFDFVAKYKFHIAFENAFLKDYITEKLIRAYHVGSVPIYKGAPSAKDWTPSNKSTIFVDEFQSPKQLANFITYLDKNDLEYETYLRYKTDGISNDYLWKNLLDRKWKINDVNYPNILQSYECHICDEIIKRIESEDRKQPIQTKFANHSHFGCQQPYTLLVDPDELPTSDPWRKTDWIGMYWRAFDQCLAVNAMIQSNETDSSKFDYYLRNIYDKRLKLK